MSSDDSSLDRPVTLPARARHTRDRATIAVFGIGALAAGTSTAAALHRWLSLADGQARALGCIAAVAGGFALLKVVSRIFPWIFRATRWERDDSQPQA